jgi:hypothetical protein
VVSVTPRPRFTPGERNPSTDRIGGWVGPRAGLDAGDRRKILCPCRGSNPDRPACSQTLYWLSYHGSSSSSIINNTNLANLQIHRHDIHVLECSIHKNQEEDFIEWQTILWNKVLLFWLNSYLTVFFNSFRSISFSLHIINQTLVKSHGEVLLYWIHNKKKKFD